ncbi:MAG: hypothetical protein ABI597_10440 [Gammaproteobacteria bacterium]
MSLPQLQQLLNNELVALYQQIEKDLSFSQHIAAKVSDKKILQVITADDFEKMNSLKNGSYSWYISLFRIGSIVELWKKIKNSPSLETAVEDLLLHHSQLANHGFSTTIYGQHSLLLFNAISQVLDKAIQQDLLTSSLKVKVEAEFKKTELVDIQVGFSSQRQRTPSTDLNRHGRFANTAQNQETAINIPEEKTPSVQTTTFCRIF